MVKKESVTINVPTGMAKYLVTLNPEAELTRNALLLYPYILNQTISHGRAAEILGIRKSELIDLYDKLGYSYFDMTMDELDDELDVKFLTEIPQMVYDYNIFSPELYALVTDGVGALCLLPSEKIADEAHRLAGALRIFLRLKRSRKLQTA